jgi:hypothetical protein
MLFGFLTGLLSLIFITFCLLYLMRRQFNNRSKIRKLKFHALSGYILFFVIIIHIHNQFLQLKLTAGFISFAALLLIVITGIFKRRFKGKRIYYTVHLISVVVFVLALLVHIVQEIINALLM